MKSRKKVVHGWPTCGEEDAFSTILHSYYQPISKVEIYSRNMWIVEVFEL